MSTLPDSNGIDTPMQRYRRCVRSYNIAVGRYNSALDTLQWAEREFADAEMWFNQAKDELDRAASAAGLEGAP